MPPVPILVIVVACIYAMSLSSRPLVVQGYGGGHRKLVVRDWGLTWASMWAHHLLALPSFIVFDAVGDGDMEVGGGCW
jgi:hypothetical protein